MWTSLLLVVLAVCVLLAQAQVDIVAVSRKSPRKLQMETLFNLGCGNKVIAHYVIDVARNQPSSDPKATLIARLKGIVEVTEALEGSIDTWIDAIKLIL